jgi:hypothetical protein
MMDQSFLIPADETPEQASLRKRKMVANALLSQGMPTDIGSGIAALGQAALQRQSMSNAAFPDMPGGGKPTLGMRLGNLFGRKGLY